MANVDLTCVELERGGITQTVYSSASTPALSTSDRYLVTNNGYMSVFIETGGTATTVSIEIPQTYDGLAIPDREVTVPANTLMGIGHWPTANYNNVDGKIAFSLSSVTDVKLFCSCLE